MTDYSGRLRLAFQLLNENPDTWGSIQNSGDFQLLEDSIAGSVDVDVTLGNVTLTKNDGGNDTARYAVLNITGAPGANRSVFVPEGTDGGGTAPVVNTTKLYFVIDSTTGGDIITIITASGTGIALGSGTAQWVYCDGTNVIDASYALTSGTAAAATLAADSTLFSGGAVGTFAKLATAQSFTKAQTSLRTALTSGATVAVDSTLSNKFYLATLEAFTLANPTGAVDGKTISIVFKQSTGGPWNITFGSAWAFQAASHPQLTQTLGAYDQLVAEYEAVSGTWIGGMLKDVRNS